MVDYPTALTLERRVIWYVTLIEDCSHDTSNTSFIIEWDYVRPFTKITSYYETHETLRNSRASMKLMSCYETDEQLRN